MEPIHDYAIIGDCRSAALVSRSGSIDWLCWPRFDSPSLFGALLDEAAGRWRIAPTTPFRTERRYVEGTNVLRTTFHTHTGSMTLTDLMPVASEEGKRSMLVADHELLRRVECERGELEVEMVFAPRPGYGRERPRIRDAGRLGLRLELDSGLLVLRTDMPLPPPGDGRVRARARMRAGEAFHLSLTFADQWPGILPPLGSWTREAIARSVAWWRGWIARLQYDGPGREAVVRSALVLKLLVYAPSGAVVAAPTTSLPEQIGGSLNWDYRYCWLRDTALTVRALFGLGYEHEAHAFVSWLIHTTRLTQPDLRILYDVHGNQPHAERTIGSLSGYRGSRPVRLGNAAMEQLQLDVYGEVIDAATQVIRRGGLFDRETQRMLLAFGKYVCQNWHRQDEGIWEPRGGRAHHTHSRLLCWTALERLLELHVKGHVRGASASDFARARALIWLDLKERSWNPSLQSYVAHPGGEELDASLLLMSWYGFEKASSYRMRRTHARILERLSAGRGLLYRYRSAGEGAFGVCCFWGVEHLALGAGTLEEALRTFEELLVFANDVGLYAEEIDPATGAALGNFPQAFTHVGLINAALSLVRRLEGRKPLGRRVRSREEIERLRA